MLELDRLADALAGLRPVRTQARLCLSACSPRAACTRCRDICPEGAVQLEPGPKLADCSACGLCAAVCPSDAFLLDGPSDPQLLKQTREVARRFATASVACAEAAGGPHVITVRCLGRLTAELLLAMAATGVRRVELVRPSDGCQACRFRAGGPLIEAAATEVNRVLADMHRNVSVVFAHRPSAPAARVAEAPAGTAKPAGPDPAADMDRRSFLRSAFGLLRQTAPAKLAGLGPKAAAAPTVEPLVGGWGNETGGGTTRREMLLQTLSELEPRPDVPGWHRQVRLTGTCTDCGICGALCPRQAIALARTGDAVRLEHSPQRCLGCGLCSAVCPAAVLTLSGPVKLADLLQPGPRPLGRPAACRCQVCGEEYPGNVPLEPAGEQICLACIIKRGVNERGA